MAFAGLTDQWLACHGSSLVIISTACPPLLRSLILHCWRAAAGRDSIVTFASSKDRYCVIQHRRSGLPNGKEGAYVFVMASQTKIFAFVFHRGQAGGLGLRLLSADGTPTTVEIRVKALLVYLAF